MRGQALVEMALITPILLLLVLGVFQVGLAMLTQMELQHAAQQAATTGACDVAVDTVPLIYGSVPDSVECTEPDGIIRITVTDAAPIIGPWGVWNIEATGRAVTP